MAAPRKILICEDEDAIREFEVINLQRSGYEVVDVSCGEDAIRVFDEQGDSFSVAILDIMMPGIDGFAVCKHIREKNNTLGIIMLSAKGEIFDKVLGLELGADDYMAKPFNPLELVARVKALLRRADAQTSELRRGELLLNLSSHELWKNDRQITLTPMEYKLLSLMMKNPGRIFTKAQLYENINGEFFESDENTIMVHISKLRDKIETDPKQPVYIKTVRGVGYRFEV